MRSALLLPLLVACGSNEGRGTHGTNAPPGVDELPSDPVRIRLFDLMPAASWERDASADEPPADPVTRRFDFEAAAPEQLWFGRLTESRVAWDARPLAVDPSSGREGAGLRLGPAPDYSFAAFVVPVEGTCRVRVRARVRLEDNPKAADASTRECLRLSEHSRASVDPSRVTRLTRADLRLSRRHDPSGWDVVSGELVTDARTRSVEVHLLHRSGGDETATTRFDDVELEVVPLSPARVLEEMVARYRPDDGQEASTPWRLRVGLESTVRDAVLLAAPTALRLGVTLPASEHTPRLRFSIGALLETRRTRGDGAKFTVAFGEGGVETMLGQWTIDVRAQREHRGWLDRVVDLGPVAGRKGELIFRADDLDGERDLDLLLLSNPRIEPAAEAPRGMNVLLIGVDTLRADRLSALGYERDTTPHLKALADDGVRFTACRSQAPWTLPSFSSTLTSLYPSVHNAGRGGHDVWTPIDPSTISLAEVLARVGYETVGQVSNFLISPRYGLDQGFESHTTLFSMDSVTSDAVPVEAFLREHTSTPWLFFWHIMDPHLPYTTDASFREAFTQADYAGRFQRGGREPQVPFHDLDPRPNRRWYTHEGPPPLPDLTPDDRRFVSDFYDAEIAEMDAALGRVLQALKDSGQWERTLVAFVADHGEGLGDHDHYHHGYTLFDDQVHIPLILRIPGRHAGLVVERPVAAIDLAPTLLGALGLPIPASFQGVDRLAEDAPTGDAYFIEYPTYDSSAQKAWVRGRFKYLHDPVFHTEALYDLVADPAERTDVASRHPELVAEARAAMDAFRWEQLQVGRYHLRVRGRPGQALSLRVSTDDLFDANFVARPALPEEHFAMDLDRRNLTLETTLEEGRLELVFWGRGDELEVQASLDGEWLELELPGDEDAVALPWPARIPRNSIPPAQGTDLRWPAQEGLLLWLEAGAREMLPVVNTPEEIEALRAMGYAR